MKSHRGRDAGRRTRRAGAVVLGAALVAAAPGAASAATETPTWWWDTYGIAALHEQGWTGEGVTIAVMDAQINPDLPAFEGRSLTVAEDTVCAEYDSPVSTEVTEGAVHGTTVTATLIGTGADGSGLRGIAPDAEVIFYSMGRADSGADCTSPEDPDVLSQYGLALKRAIEDGADIFTTSVGSPWESEEGDGAVIAEAIAKGVVLVNATRNPGVDLDQETLGLINGVLATSAVDSEGDLQTTPDGLPYALPHTHVVAAGVQVPSVGVAGGTWEDSGPASGSSFAAPLVAGMLALAAQRYPEATGNQLAQALIHSTNGSIHEPTYEPESGYGYGAAWPATLLQSDPTQYPDENPLMDRPHGIPSVEQVADAVAREAASAAAAEPSPEPTEEAGAAPDQTDPPASIGIAVVVALIAAVAGGVIIALIIATRRKRLPLGDTP